MAIKIDENGKKYDDETGELYTEKELEQFSEEKLIKDQEEYYKRNVEYGLKTKLKVSKITKKSDHKTMINKGEEFNKMFRNVDKIINSDEFNAKELAIMSGFAFNVQYPNNDVQINEDYSTFKDIGKLYGCSINTMTKVINRLEELGIIKVIRGSKVPPVVYFNPFIVCSGQDVNTDVYEMFKHTEYNQKNLRDYKTKTVHQLK